MSSWKWMAAVLVCGCLGAPGLRASQVGMEQESSPVTSTTAQATAAPQQPATPATAAPEAPAAQESAPQQDAPKGSGKVLFSRSEDEGHDSGAKPDAAARPGVTGGLEATAEEREALTFKAYDLDVHLVPRQESLAVRAQLTVRNDGEKPLGRIALQLSSTLKWERVRAAGIDAKFAQHLVDSDVDHTGAVNEAVVTLARELAPGAELKLEVFYSGVAAVSGERLERIGAPNIQAERSDWDRVSADFIGLRGFGNVVWYPVSAQPALLGDGAKLFREMGRQKQRQQSARIAIKVTSEYSADATAPNLAILDGQVVRVVETAAPENSYPGVVTATLPETDLGFAAPSLFLLSRQKVDAGELQVYVTPEDAAGAQAYVTAVHVVDPLVRQWLGPAPKSPLSVVELPDPGDLAAEEGAVYFSGFKASPDPKELENAMVHSLAHAYFHSSRIWLNEGVAQFLGSLWVEQVEGRHAALEAVSASRGALALAEPGTPGQGGGEELSHASEVVYYRTKATYVLWMLRDLAGDGPLAAALAAYVPSEDTTPEYFERLLEKASGKDLKWFFADWVYRDRGLPDLAIAGVYPSHAAEGQWLVALDIANDGFAEAEVPVSVRSKEGSVTERLRIPAQQKVSRRILIGGEPTQVQVNDGTVPEVRESEHVRTLTGGAP